MEQKYKEPTANMKAVLLDLLAIVRTEDNGKAGTWRDIHKTHHMTLKAMAKQAYGCLIQLEAVYADSPTAIIWRVAITRYGLKVAKQIEKEQSRNNDTNINADEDKKKKPRSLRTIQWQVDVNHKAGEKIYKDAKAMKADRKQSFTQVMNLLMQLHEELKAGQVHLLQKLYPEAYTTMLLIARNEIEMEREGELRGLIAEFKRHIQNAPQATNIGANFKFSADDDTVVIDVQKDANAGKIASQNFLRSVMALNPEPPQPPSIRKLVIPPAPLPVDEDIEIEW